MCALEAARRLRLEENARARAQVLFVELPLVERAIPPAAVEGREPGEQQLHALETVDVGDGTGAVRHTTATTATTTRAVRPQLAHAQLHRREHACFALL